jgi:hypothetical protein
MGLSKRIAIKRIAKYGQYPALKNSCAGVFYDFSIGLST